MARSKRKKKLDSSSRSVMRKAHIHKNEDGKLYNRKRTKKEEREYKDE